MTVIHVPVCSSTNPRCISFCTKAMIATDKQSPTALSVYCTPYYLDSVYLTGKVTLSSEELLSIPWKDTYCVHVIAQGTVVLKFKSCKVPIVNNPRIRYVDRIYLDIVANDATLQTEIRQIIPLFNVGDPNLIFPIWRQQRAIQRLIRNRTKALALMMGFHPRLRGETNQISTLSVDVVRLHILVHL
jgi:hypothetical protein